MTDLHFKAETLTHLNDGDAIDVWPDVTGERHLRTGSIYTSPCITQIVAHITLRDGELAHGLTPDEKVSVESYLKAKFGGALH